MQTVRDNGRVVGRSDGVDGATGRSLSWGVQVLNRAWGYVAGGVK